MSDLNKDNPLAIVTLDDGFILDLSKVMTIDLPVKTSECGKGGRYTVTLDGCVQVHIYDEAYPASKVPGRNRVFPRKDLVNRFINFKFSI